MIACVWLSVWPEGEAGAGLVERLASRVPRLVAEPGRGRVWADVRGLPAEAYGRLLRDEAGVGASVGVAMVAGVAGAAARVAAGAVRMASGEVDRSRGVLMVPEGGEREFLAPLPLSVLEPEPRLATLLEGVGVLRCGELAALAREPVEVRFGAEGVHLWRRARADDRRPLFGARPSQRPEGSVDFVDYVVTDPARLLFTANALLGPICERLQARGEHARRLVLELALANGRSWRRVLRMARPTASRERWLRRLRGLLERLTVDDAVAGVRLVADGLETAAVEQGDLFDRGFATAAAVELAVARLAEDREAPVVVKPETDAHPLLERATRWVEWDGRSGARRGATGADHAGGVPGGAGEAGGAEGTVGATLVLQLLAEPRVITVATTADRDAERPVRYREAGIDHVLVTVAGPDRISGGRWDAPYAREYFRCVTEEGTLVWIYRDGRTGGWFVHGWWD